MKVEVKEVLVMKDRALEGSGTDGGHSEEAQEGHPAESNSRCSSAHTHCKVDLF